MTDQPDLLPTEPTQPVLEAEKPLLEFQDLTLWQVLWLAVYRPGVTLRHFFEEISLPPEAVDAREPLARPFEFGLRRAPIEAVEQDKDEEVIWIDAPREPLFPELSAEFSDYVINLYPLVIVIGMLFSFWLAVVGAGHLWKAVNNPIMHAEGDTNAAPFWFLMAGLLYVGVITLAHLPSLIKTIQQLGGGNAPPPDYPTSEPDEPITEPIEEILGVSEPATPTEPFSIFRWIERHSIRLALIPVAMALSYVAYTENVLYRPNGTVEDIVLTRTGGIAWFLSILLWFLLLGVDLNRVAMNLYRRMSGLEVPQPIRRVRWTWYPGWQHIVLLLIFLLAAWFRLHRLTDAPPEMTSDHIEKLLDALKIKDGHYAVFFPNNEGREAFQMHFIALLAELGLGFTFTTMKLATVIEGLITIPLGYWLGVTLMGRETDEDREMGVWLGLGFAALLAVSSWHVMLSRLALRIVLTPLTTILVTIFLIRGIRYNRRMDFVWMGFWLGAGTYFYQSNRMLPLLVIAGVGLAILAHIRQREVVGRYLLNLICAGVLAIAIFVPMYRYGKEFPDLYWKRTTGRMFGEHAFVRVDPDTGQTVEYEPTTSDEIKKFWENREQLVENYKNAFEMFGWEGDGTWFHNGEARPALDPYTNALFMVGLFAWAVLMIQKRRVVFLLVPVGILIMMLPSTLALAAANENPSFTRSSGVIPFAFLIAAYPLAQLAYYARRISSYQVAMIPLVVLLCTYFVSKAESYSYDNYFETYREGYIVAWKPYEAFAKPLREFAESEQGSYGNAFVVAYPHWLDHRILGAVAGNIRWGNTLPERDHFYGVIMRNQGTQFEYDPDKPLFFMYNRNDTDTQAWLHENFPGGTDYMAAVEERFELNFYYYITPAPYSVWVSNLAGQRAIEAQCLVNCMP